MRTIEMTGKTVEDAVEAACRALGVDRDDLGVSYEVLEFPARRLFKSIPAKVYVKVEEPEAPAAAPAQPAPEVKEVKAEAAPPPRKPRPPPPKPPPKRPPKPRRRRPPPTSSWTSKPTRS